MNFTSEEQLRASPNVRRLNYPGTSDYYVTNEGVIYSTKMNRVAILKQVPHSNGYPQSKIQTNTGPVMLASHRLVAFTWIKNPENKPYVNHIDGNKHNSHPTNLEFVTHIENCQHAVKTGLTKHTGQTIIQFSLDGNVVKEYDTIVNAVKETKFGKNGISACLYGRTASYNGFIWRIKYPDCSMDDLVVVDPPVGKYSKDGKLLETFKTVDEALESIEMKVLKLRGLTFLNNNTDFVWKYVVMPQKVKIGDLSNPAIWKPINKYPNYMISIHGEVYSTYCERIIKPAITRGRANIKLTKNETADYSAKYKTYFVYRLIAEAFIPNPHGYKIVNHLNGDPLDNKISNLEWCTNKRNVNHALETGLIKTQKQVIQLCAKTGVELKRFVSASEAAKELNAASSGITNAARNQTTITNKGLYKWKYA